MEFKASTKLSCLKIPLAEILEATNNFADKNIIGRGGFGNVYKGKLTRDGQSRKIAARRLGRKEWQGDVEFWTEISMLSTLKLPWSVTLVGFCDEEGEKIIINDHYPKGSLAMHLSDPITLDWDKRLLIAHRLIFSLVHLHDGADPDYYVIHRNFNSFTILLDDDMDVGVLSGFEHSIKLPVGQKNQIYRCEAIGTQGYIDPATKESGGVTHKSDIYSLGIVLFEILCGRKANENNTLLGPLAKFHYDNKTLPKIIHPDLLKQMKPETFKWLSETAYSCLQEDRTLRPEALQLLENSMEKRTNRHGVITFMETMPDRHGVDETDLASEIKEYLENMPFRPSKVKNMEHWRIELRDILLALERSKHDPDLSFKGGHSENLWKVDLECFNREHLPFVKGVNKDELVKKHYTVMIKRINVVEFRKVCGQDYLPSEVKIISSCNHENIESFLGFSEMEDTIFLVSEFVSTSHLSVYLNDSIFTWEKRLKICIDVARGLNYLHNKMEDQKMVLHGYIDCRNILLDRYNWSAKIDGFCRSIFWPATTEFPLGKTKEYLKFFADLYTDPEYIETGCRGIGSDVFSFGVVMLEILCGMSASALMTTEGYYDETHDCHTKDVAHLAEQWFNEGIPKRKVTPIISTTNAENIFFLNKGPNEDSLDRFIKIMYKCLARNRNQRPTMEVVVKKLEKAFAFQENHEGILRMSFQDIELATQNFGHAIGEGGSGRVFKGKVAHEHDNGFDAIVAKKLDKSQGQRNKQFYNELQILYKYKHDNVIGLVGYSNETDEKIIIYEYASKGSLDNHLDNTKLTWLNRLNICIDVATGLDFLHGGVGEQEVVIHRDIKSANILLFDDWKAKLGDFGLSLISTINKDSNYAIASACGTWGYVDPLYVKSSLLTTETDIFSFGVVLFEILCGKAIYTIPKHERPSLLSFIKHKFEEGKQNDMVFKAIKEEIVSKSLSVYMNIVYKCLDDDREKRPTSKEVLVQLNKALEFQPKCA